MNIYQRLNKVHKAVKSIIKEGEIQAGNSSYTVVTYDSVIGILHMPFAEAGIAPISNMVTCQISSFDKTKEWQGKQQTTTWYRAEVEAKIVFTNIDEPTDTFTSSAVAYAFDTGDKAPGKAYTMALKMILMKVAMLESMDQEEAREFEEAQYKEKPAVQKPIPKPVTTAIVSKDARNIAPISKGQAEMLMALAQKFGYNSTQLLQIASHIYKVTKSSEIKVWQYSELTTLFTESKGIAELSDNVEALFSLHNK